MLEVKPGVIALISKNLLAVPLCFALLLIPVVSVRESSDPDPFPAYEDFCPGDGDC